MVVYLVDPRIRFRCFREIFIDGSDIEDVVFVYKDHLSLSDLLHLVSRCELLQLGQRILEKFGKYQLFRESFKDVEGSLQLEFIPEIRRYEGF